MKQIFYLVAIIVTMYFAFRVMSKVKVAPNGDEKKEPVKPDKEIPNDKIIWVTNVNKTQIESVLNDFCKMYNDGEYAALPRLIPVSESRFAITFPYDDALEIVCYLVNYLNYPVDMEWDAAVLGWATVENEPSWEDDKNILNKEIMLYCSPEKQNGFEHVEIVTSDNIGFRINLNSEITEDEFPEKQYIAPEFLADLTDKEHLDFE